MTYDAKSEGALFKNDRKQSDSHPDYTGSWTDANGVEHWLNAWVNEYDGGKKYIKLKMGSAKDEKKAPSKPAASHAVEIDDPAASHAVEIDDSDDLPF